MAIKFEKGLKSKLIGLIPIYGGYRKKERRRETDRLIREKAKSFLEHGKEAIDQITTTLVQLGKRQSIPLSEKLRSMIDVVVLKLKSAEYGATGFFDFESVDTKKLEIMAMYDARIVVKSKNFQKHCEELADKILTNPDIFPKEAMALMREIEVVKKDFDRRADILSGTVDIEKEADYFGLEG
jgi:hypothetical protein